MKIYLSQKFLNSLVYGTKTQKKEMEFTLKEKMKKGGRIFVSVESVSRLVSVANTNQEKLLELIENLTEKILPFLPSDLKLALRLQKELNLNPETALELAQSIQNSMDVYWGLEEDLGSQKLISFFNFSPKSK